MSSQSQRDAVKLATGEGLTEPAQSRRRDVLDEATSSRAAIAPAGFIQRVMVLSAVIALGGTFVLSYHVWLVFFAGGLFAIVLFEAGKKLELMTGRAQRTMSVATFIALIVIIAAIAALFGAQVTSQYQELIGQLPNAWNRLSEMLGSAGFGRIRSNELVQNAPVGSILTQVSTVLSSGLNLFLNLFLILFSGIFLALEPARYREGIVALFPRSRRSRIREVFHANIAALSAWLRAQVIIMIAVGITVTIGLWLLGMPYFLALGLLAGAAEFVPILGPLIASIPAILIGLTIDLNMAIYVMLLYFAINQLEGNLLTPLVQEHEASLPPVLTLIGTLLMGALFGLGGLILAVPLVLVFMTTVRMLYVEDVLGGQSEEEEEAAGRDCAKGP